MGWLSGIRSAIGSAVGRVAASASVITSATATALGTVAGSALGSRTRAIWAAVRRGVLATDTGASISRRVTPTVESRRKTGRFRHAYITEVTGRNAYTGLLETRFITVGSRGEMSQSAVAHAVREMMDSDPEDYPLIDPTIIIREHYVADQLATNRHRTQ